MERPGTDEWPAEEGEAQLQLASEDEEELPLPPDSQMHRADRRKHNGGWQGYLRGRNLISPDELRRQAPI